MGFSSSIFMLFFLPIMLFGNYIVFKRSRKWQNIFLCLGSLLFYAWGEPLALVILLISIIMNWLFGLGLKRGLAAKPIVAISVFLNVAMLFVFKYLAFFLDNIGLALKMDLSFNSLIFPIGISFYTFQAISYVVDVAKGKCKAQGNLLNVGLYIAFFPRVLQGPIVRYETIADEIENRKETVNDFAEGTIRFIGGLAKKVILADNLAHITNTAFSVTNLSISMAWLGAIAYALQIYLDFSGYSDMAIGLGRMFGFHFPENFNYPYISKSVTEFWRRWHISLSLWFRDYVYIPLGGNRVGKIRMVVNLLIVWLLTGIWHGANWTFILWGLVYFAVLVIEKNTGLAKHETDNLFVNSFKRLYTLLVILICWVLFRSASIGAAVTYLKCLAGISGNSAVFDPTFIKSLTSNYIVLILSFLASVPIAAAIPKAIRESRPARACYAVVLFIMLIVAIGIIVTSSYTPFIYGKF